MHRGLPQPSRRSPSHRFGAAPSRQSLRRPDRRPGWLASPSVTATIVELRRRRRRAARAVRRRPAPRRRDAARRRRRARPAAPAVAAPAAAGAAAPATLPAPFGRAVGDDPSARRSTAPMGRAPSPAAASRTERGQVALGVALADEDRQVGGRRAIVGVTAERRPGRARGRPRRAPLARSLGRQARAQRERRAHRPRMRVDPRGRVAQQCRGLRQRDVDAAERGGAEGRRHRGSRRWRRAVAGRRSTALPQRRGDAERAAVPAGGDAGAAVPEAGPRQVVAGARRPGRPVRRRRRTSTLALPAMPTACHAAALDGDAGLAQSRPAPATGRCRRSSQTVSSAWLRQRARPSTTHLRPCEQPVGRRPAAWRRRAPSAFRRPRCPSCCAARWRHRGRARPGSPAHRYGLRTA